MAVKFKSMAALALSAAMLLSMAACGTTDSADSSASASSSNTTTGYDVSGVQKDDELAKLVTEGTTVKDGELSSGMELSYAPAEFYAEDGKTPVGYDVDMTKAIAQVLGLKTPPRVIESYDISNWGDGSSVCGMVVFKDWQALPRRLPPL